MKRGTKVVARSDRKGVYNERLARDVKVDQTIKLQVGNDEAVKLYAVIQKDVSPNGDCVLSIRYLPPFRNEIRMLAFVDRARAHFAKSGNPLNESILLDRQEGGVQNTPTELKRETLRNNSTCACCGGQLRGGELTIRAGLTPVRGRPKTRFFHYHDCMSANQQYKAKVLNLGIEHIDCDKLTSLNEKAFIKARDFQMPWVILSECTTNFLFAYDTRSLNALLEMMTTQGTPAKYLCRVNRTSLNMEHPMSDDQFSFLVAHEEEDLIKVRESGARFVTCAETVADQLPVYEYANTIEEIQSVCRASRMRNDVSCYGFVSI